MAEFKDFGSKRKEPTGSWWDSLWGTFWFELIILLLFMFAIVLLMFPFLHERFALSWEYAKVIVNQIIKPIFIVMDGIILFGLIFATIKGWAWRPKFSIFERYEGHGTTKKKTIDHAIVAQWEKIAEKLKINTAESLRLALIDADTIVDVYLRKAGYEGETMAERLSQVLGSDTDNLQEVWKAHRLRNDVVHTPGFDLSADSAKEAVAAFEYFLKNCGAIE